MQDYDENDLNGSAGESYTENGGQEPFIGDETYSTAPQAQPAEEQESPAPNEPYEAVPPQTPADGPVGGAPESNDSYPYGSSYPYGATYPYGSNAGKNAAHPYGGSFNSNQTEAGRPNGDRPYGNQPYGNQPYGNQPNGNQPYGNQPYGNQSYGNQPYGNQPYGNRPYGNQPYGNQPYGDPSNGTRSAYSRNTGSGYAYPAGGVPAKKKNVGAGIFIAIAVVLLLAVGALIVSGVFGRFMQKNTGTESDRIDNVGEVVTAASPESPAFSAEDGTLSPSLIYKKVLPSSVGILVYDSNKKLSSEGSGVIFKEDDDGEYTYIITCAHVITERGASIMVQLSDEKEYKAERVGYDNKTDIGVLRIKESGLTAIEIGDSQKLNVGDCVYAIGNPGGTEFANSFTAGMISAIDRPVSSSSTGYTMECIQHTAAINPGNSGGALVNSFGQLIGINSMKIVASDYEGMGFSVPSSVFVRIVNEIIANGYVTNRPKIGITYLPATSEQAYAMFVAIKGLPQGAIIVYSIASDSSLADSKLQKGDLIVGVDGKDLTSTSMLAEMVEKGKVGDKLKLSIVRINSDYTYEEFEVTATLVEDKGDTTLTEEEETTTSYFDDYFGSRSGGGDYYDDFFDDFFGSP